MTITMKTLTLACFSALAILPRFGTAWTDYPTLQYDPETISPCVIWENNARNLVCEDVRDYWSITPEEFSRWNPSVGLDCKPWIPASYCVVPKERLPEDPTTTTEEPTVTTTTTTTSTATLGPSPTSWSDRGCYIDDDEEVPTLQKRISDEAGDDDLTVPKCQDACYKGFFVFAGVRDGNECHCGSYVAGEKTLNATECDAPCSGDAEEVCGGPSRLNVYMALDNDAPVTTTRTSATTSTTTAAS